MREKAKEKAIEIFTTINKKLESVDTYHSLDCYVKDLAIYQCNEMIEVLDKVSIGESGTTKIDYGQYFYLEVIKEIENYNTH